MYMSLMWVNYTINIDRKIIRDICTLYIYIHVSLAFGEMVMYDGTAL